LTESESAGITQKDNLIRKVIHAAAWNVPEKDILFGCPFSEFLQGVVNAVRIRRISRCASGSPKSLIGWVLKTISRVTIFNPSVYAACPTFPPDSFSGYRRRLGLSNVRDIC
jgi:hypothetical protein